MGYIGNRPTAVPLTSADIQDGVITAADLGANSVDSSELVDNSVTLAKMAGLARGKLIYGDASGDPAALAVGGADEVLTHDGTDLSWAAAGGVVGSTYFIATSTGTQAITSATTTLIDFGEEALDVGSDYDVSTSRFTAPATGDYLMGYGISVDSVTASKITGSWIYPFKNGAQMAVTNSREASTYFRFDTPATVISLNKTWIQPLSAGDYVEIYIYPWHTDGGANTHTIRAMESNWWGMRLA